MHEYSVFAPKQAPLTEPQLVSTSTADRKDDRREQGALNEQGTLTGSLIDSPGV